MKLGDGMITVLVGKNGLPAKYLTAKVVFLNSTESKVRANGLVGKKSGRS